MEKPFENFYGIPESFNEIPAYSGTMILLKVKSLKT